MLTVTNQIKAARALLGWDQFELCKRAGLSISTIRRLEASEGFIEAHYGTVVKVCDALKCAGIHFIDGPNYGVQLTNGDGSLGLVDRFCTAGLEGTTGRLFWRACGESSGCYLCYCPRSGSGPWRWGDSLSGGCDLVAITLYGAASRIGVTGSGMPWRSAAASAPLTSTCAGVGPGIAVALEKLK